MSTTSRKQEYDVSTRGLWAWGIGAFAGVVMVTVGLFQLLEGISAVLEDDVLVVTHDYLYSISLTGWGWIHLGVGAVMMVVGICVLYGQTWARAVGLLIAVLSAVSSFAFLPHFPIWSLLVITLDVLVIWALSSLLSNS
ncbi:hypothetical protein [Nocardioides sp.]|uniref:DUF7144 family membrane protein n=1 Tax=Nocardioides sp. TaxID=35761 RepID=UPI003783CBB8